MKQFIFIIVFCFFSVSISAQESNVGNNKNNDAYINLRIPTNSEADRTKAKNKEDAALAYLMRFKDPLPSNVAREMQDKKLRDDSVLLAINKPERFISSVVYTDLQPGSESIKLNISMGLPVTIIFKSVAGLPVNVFSLNTPKLHFVANKPGENKSLPAADIEGGSTSSRPDNVLILTAKLLKGGANMPVFTTASDFPVSFDVTIKPVPENEYISRLVVVVDDGSSDDVLEGGNKLKSRDSLMLVLNNLPPTDNAEIVRFNDGMIKAWRDGDNLWIRTKMRLFYPVHLPENVASFNGVKVYKTKYSPVITVKTKNGKIVRLKEGNSYGKY